MQLDECTKEHRALWNRMLFNLRYYGLEHYIKLTYVDRPEYRFSVDALKWESDPPAYLNECYFCAYMNEGICEDCPVSYACTNEDGLLARLERCTSYAWVVHYLKRIRDIEVNFKEDR